ncbi:MAG TPA: tRNA pseudouridine(38-40) synthase TruA, partial [Luteimonas sp.]|nr:tRNA pseudouridine(38-40) synthase TruA [Luteimonas sp.]
MRYALGVEYDGSGFSGWQRLGPPGGEALPTVQAALEAALAS